VSADSIVPEPGNPQALNRYAYGFSNPLKYIDPTGHCATENESDSCGSSRRSSPVKITKRADWDARQPVIYPYCIFIFCFIAGTKEGKYDSVTNPDGYAPYSQLQPGKSLAEIYHTVVIHHEGDSQTYDNSSVQNKHMDENGWSDIGYEYAISPDGTIYEGRDISVRGSHVAGANTGSIGILIMGDFEPGMEVFGHRFFMDFNGDDPGPTQAQIRSAIALVVQLDERYGIDRVEGHRDAPRQSTKCPGEQCMTLVRELDALVR